MKKVVSVASVALLATTLVGCGSSAGASGDTDKITVHTHMSQLVLGEEKKMITVTHIVTSQQRISHN